MWNLLRLALDWTLRNTASTKILAFWTQNLTWVGFDTASIKMLPFWTQKLTGVGFEPTHTFVYQKSQRRISWVWRLRPLGHPALSISLSLHPVFDKPSCNVKSASSGSWFDSQKYCFDQIFGFLNAKIDRSGIRTHAHIRVPEVSKENFLSLAP